MLFFLPSTVPSGHSLPCCAVLLVPLYLKSSLYLTGWFIFSASLFFFLYFLLFHDLEKSPRGCLRLPSIVRPPPRTTFFFFLLLINLASLKLFAPLLFAFPFLLFFLFFHTLYAFTFYSNFFPAVGLCPLRHGGLLSSSRPPVSIHRVRPIYYRT